MGARPSPLWPLPGPEIFPRPRAPTTVPFNMLSRVRNPSGHSCLSHKPGIRISAQEKVHWSVGLQVTSISGSNVTGCAAPTHGPEVRSSVRTRCTCVQSISRIIFAVVVLAYLSVLDKWSWEETALCAWKVWLPWKMCNARRLRWTFPSTLPHSTVLQLSSHLVYLQRCAYILTGIPSDSSFRNRPCHMTSSMSHRLLAGKCKPSRTPHESEGHRRARWKSPRTWGA